MEKMENEKNSFINRPGPSGFFRRTNSSVRGAIRSGDLTVKSLSQHLFDASISFGAKLFIYLGASEKKSQAFFSSSSSSGNIGIL